MRACFGLNGFHIVYLWTKIVPARTNERHVPAVPVVIYSRYPNTAYPSRECCFSPLIIRPVKYSPKFINSCILDITLARSLKVLLAPVSINPELWAGYTWKKNRTTKTCSAPIEMMRAIWIKLKLTMRPSVLCTVAKLRFSRVRKYFWLREMVEIWPEILNIDSSRTDVCSGDVPCFEGSCARDSFSTWVHVVSSRALCNV